jgi:hypothetical protein
MPLHEDFPNAYNADAKIRPVIGEKTQNRLWNPVLIVNQYPDQNVGIEKKSP